MVEGIACGHRHKTHCHVGMIWQVVIVERMGFLYWLCFYSALFWGLYGVDHDRILIKIRLTYILRLCKQLTGGVPRAQGHLGLGSLPRRFGSLFFSDRNYSTLSAQDETWPLVIQDRQITSPFVSLHLWKSTF